MTGEELFRDQLLETKFLISAASHALIQRPRLMALLDACPRRPLTLISAPAGFGKTTLLSQWVRALPQESIQVAWISLDEGDNDPVRFWRYVLTALDRLQPGMCTDLVTRLRTRPSPPLPYLLAALVNGLVQIPNQVLLVLDDYHLITDQAVHASLTSLVEHLPMQLRVVLSTRVDPPFPLSRLRARSQLLEVRTEQLRCDAIEVEDFLRQIVGVALSGAEIEQMTSRTGGWVAGLQMLDLSLKKCEDPLRLQEEVTGSHCHILDYLTEEVLRQQPPAIQRFLLHTSPLERFTAPLCDAVLEQRESQGILEELKRANLFLIPLDSQRRWYRYHPLFAEALRFMLERSDPETIALIHRRASAWFAERGYTGEAIHHAIHARDWSQAADLIEAEMQLSAQRRCEQTTLRQWIEQLPSEIVRTRPHLCLALAQPRSIPLPNELCQPHEVRTENVGSGPVGTRGGHGEERGPCACPGHTSRPVGTRGGHGEGRGPCACPGHTTILSYSVDASPDDVPQPGQAQGPHTHPTPPPAATNNPIRANRPLLRSVPQQDLLDPLSLRELEVLHLIVQGATNAEIALTLTLAVETIKRHVSNILSKLGVANRTQAAVRAHNLGLLCEHQ